jgi:hypothetical protein
LHSGGWSPNWVHSARRPLTGLLYLPRVIMRMENLVEWMSGETEVLWENLPRRHFVHHKSHLTSLQCTYSRSITTKHNVGCWSKKTITALISHLVYYSSRMFILLFACLLYTWTKFVADVFVCFRVRPLSMPSSLISNCQLDVTLSLLLHTISIGNLLSNCLCHSGLSISFHSSSNDEHPLPFRLKNNQSFAGEVTDGSSAQ